MGYTLFIIIGIVLFIILFLFLFFFRREFGVAKKKKKKKKEKDRTKILSNANKKLSINPRDPEAISALAELHFKEETWDKAYKFYSMLLDLVPLHPELNEFELNLNYGMAALKLNNYEEAYKGLMVAKNIDSENFLVNFHLGQIEYQKQNFEKAYILLTHAQNAQPEHIQTNHLLGLSLYQIKKYSEASVLLEKATEYEPDDKEALFCLAQCYFELGNKEKSLMVFNHLRTDPKLGAKAALMAGIISISQVKYGQAIMSFEIGLRHESIDPEIQAELLYRLADAYFKKQDVERALNLLLKIYNIKPNYKNVSELIVQYKELSSNKNLQIYLISPTSEFVTLCRKITMDFFSNARVKILDITIIKNQYTDVLAEIDTKSWEDLILFRFIRSTGTVGELVLRELHVRCKELRAGRGICIHAGDFSEGAKQFVEARLIDLIKKKELIKLFKRII